MHFSYCTAKILIISLYRLNITKFFTFALNNHTILILQVIKKVAGIKNITQQTALQVEKFRSIFPNESVCFELLDKIKWHEGFVCKKCGNANSCSGKSNYSRRCTRCKKEESVTANTLFHRCKIPLNKAFEIAFLACQAPVISSYEISRQSDIRHMTCYKLQKKIQVCKEDRLDDKLFSQIITEVNKRLLVSGAK